MEVDVHLYYDRKLSGIVNLQTSKAFTVGVRSGDVCIEKLKEAGHDKFRVYPDYEAMIKAASAGDLPVFCMNALPANYIFGEKGLDGMYLQSPAIYTSALYEAVLLNNTVLRDTVIAGFKKIGAAEQSALEEKWLGTLVHPRYSWVIRHGPKLAAAVLAITGLIGLWSVSLRREVRRRTGDLAEARDVLASTIEAIPDPLIALSADGRILAVHCPRRELLTRPASEQVDRNVVEVLPQEAAAQVMAALAEAHREGFSSGREIEVPLPRGSAWFELSVARRNMAQEGQPRFLLLSRDITTRKHDAQRIARLNRPVRTRTMRCGASYAPASNGGRQPQGILGAHEVNP
jgi:PAS domain S-box-containing protein